MFDSVVFPLMLERATSSPEFSTTVIPTGSGHEQRIGNWEDARVTFNAAMGVRSKKDIQTLINFFRARKGRLRGFLVKDLIDYQANGDVFAVGTGWPSLTHQLVRVYGDAANSDLRPIYKPIQGTVTVYRNSQLLTEGANYSINYNTGAITFTQFWSGNEVFTWYGEFYIPCRFLEDRLPADEIFFDMVENKAAGNIPDVGLIEIRDFQ